MHRSAVAGPVVALLFALSLVPAVARGDPTHVHGDFLLFPTVEFVARGHDRPPTLSATDGNARVDVLATHFQGQFKFLAEAELGTDDSEIERLQVGWEFVPNTTVWIGRYHQPASAWNIDHHHGQYLQTAITRPALEDWEDEGGIVPQHILGAVADTRIPTPSGGGLIGFLAAGFAPSVGDRQLEAISVLHRDEDPHRLSFSGRLAWAPDFVGSDELGFLVGKHEIVIERDSEALMGVRGYADFREFGFYAHWHLGSWRALGAVFRFDVDYPESPAAGSDLFWAGYLQLERSLGDVVTVFAREENSSGLDSARWLRVQNREFPISREALGVRWDVFRRNALKIEVARPKTTFGSTAELRLQWSAALP
jgi:hypothetical protein